MTEETNLIYKVNEAIQKLPKEKRDRLHDWLLQHPIPNEKNEKEEGDNK